MKELSLEQQAVLCLLRRSLWGESCALPDGIDWEAVDATAKTQAVIPFIYDGAMAMNAPVPANILQKWNQKTLYGVVTNARLMAAQSQVLGWFRDAGIPAAILKGSSVARYYPQPDLRILGDIDILIPPADIEKARAILEQNGYTFHESDHGFHLGFSRPGAYVEVHYNVTNLPDSAGGRITEKETSHFLDRTDIGTLPGHSYPVLTEANQALTLIMHMIRHMFGGGIGLRQVSDWAMYLVNTDADLFQNNVMPVLKRCGLLQYAKAASAVCVRYLGMPEKFGAWCADCSEAQCRAFMENVFSCGNMGRADEDGMGGLFTDSSAYGKKQSSLKALIIHLNQRAYQIAPITKKLKILLPFFWLFLPIRYLIRAAFGLRPKKNVVKVARSAQKKRDLHDQLKPFDIEE